MTINELILKLSYYSSSGKEIKFMTKSGKKLDINGVALFVFNDKSKKDIIVIKEIEADYWINENKNNF
jgi:hypothetical protein